MRFEDQVNENAFAKKNTELSVRRTSIRLELDVLERFKEENTDLAVKLFELPQTIRQKWVRADYEAKRRILEILWLTCEFVDLTLVPVTRKPYDILAARLFSAKSGGGGN